MALERVPADIRATGGVARMASARLGPLYILLLISHYLPLSRVTPR